VTANFLDKDHESILYPTISIMQAPLKNNNILKYYQQSPDVSQGKYASIWKNIGSKVIAQISFSDTQEG